jgi:hypothetical protein
VHCDFQFTSRKEIYLRDQQTDEHI